MADKVGNKAKAHTQYKLADGTRIPGVTTVLNILAKPQLIIWANKMGLQGIDSTKYRDAMADIGTLAHAMIAAHLKGEKLDTSEYSAQDIERAENCLIKYWDWEKGKYIHPVYVEKPLISERHKFGGTIDFYGIIDDVPTLLDFKTGKAIYPEYFYQLAAYKQLLMEHGDLPMDHQILRIGRDEDEGFEIRQITNLNKHWQVFLNCLNIYNLTKLIKKGGDDDNE